MKTPFNKVKFFISAVLFLAMALGMAVPTQMARAATLCVNPGGTGGCVATIQAAINAASPGDTINVAAGTYTENVNVNKSLTLTGASSATVTVNAANPAISIFNVTSSSVNMSGFTVSGATGGGQAGIFLGPGVALCNISSNNLTGSFDGIWLGAGSNHNTLANNTLSSNYQGFEVYISSYNTFTNNNASSNSNYGFKIDSGDHNTFTGNTANSNTKYGFYVVIGDGGGATNSTFTNNIANLNTQYGMRINGGSGNTLTGNTFDHNVLAGLRLKEVLTNLTLYSNSISGSPIGIDIDISVTDVTSWTVSHNNIVGNTTYGVSNSGTGILNAENNWWGSANGPTHSGNTFNSGSQGDKASDNVDYVPWLNAAYPGGASFAPVKNINDDPDTLFSSIQAAIAAGTTANGETITVAAGTYTENVNVNKSLTLQGASSATVIVTAASPTVSVFTVTASSVNISGFTAIGAGGVPPIGNQGYAGIKFGSGVANCNIHDNILTGNQYGILLQDPENTTTPGNNTFTNNTASSNGVSGIEMQHSYGNTFTSNTANSNGSYGFRLDGVSHNTFTSNTANSNTVNGFSLVKGSSTGGCLYNTFTNNTANSNTQYGFREDYGDHNTLTGNTFNANVLAGLRLKEVLTNLTVDSNRITNSTIGIDIATPITNVTTWIVTHNNIVGNATYGVSNLGTGVLDAENNWWSCNAGPGNIACDSISANVDADPWLVLGISTAPNAIPPGGTSTLTADLTHNSDGMDTSALGHIPDGTSVLFHTDFGSVGSSSVTKTTTNGKATATLTADAGAGVANTSATVDNQTENTAVFVTQTGAAVTGYDMATGDNPTAEFGGVTANATGNGTLVVAQYATNPAPIMLLGADGHGYYFDVHIAPPGAFTQVTIQFCGAGAGMGAILFWNGIMWVPASHQSSGAGGCVTVVVDDTSVPSLADLEGAVFGVGGPGTITSFADVLPSHWAWSWIKRLSHAGITNGCGLLLYCPENIVTRAEMAKFLLKGMHGSVYMPPAATAVFSDVPTTYWAAEWIVQLYQEGITNGCATDPLRYCPDSNVTRAEMAKFLLLAKHGSTYTPPAVGTSTGFADVSTSHWAAAWIKQLAAEGITTIPAGGNYLPESLVTRAEMAKFLVITFNLP